MTPTLPTEAGDTDRQWVRKEEWDSGRLGPCKPGRLETDGILWINRFMIRLTVTIMIQEVSPDKVPGHDKHVTGTVAGGALPETRSI